MDEGATGATVAPLIIATDKTQLTQFTGGKSAYPVYLTLGNLPKSIRRKPSQHACVLIGYLSVDKINRTQLTKQEHRARNQRLFHESMRVILAPLKKAGKEGVDMTGGDGCVRKVYPILASYVADYPEQCLVSCSKYGTCPKCQCPADKLQDKGPFPARSQKWTSDTIDEAKRIAKTTSQFHSYCMERGVSGSVYTPFWADLPHTNIHTAITPDVLHQLYQGVFKHLTNWCMRTMTQEELDKRIRCLPPAYGLRHFKNGISALSQISGTERKHMAKILLGCLHGVLPKKCIIACRSLLDFIYLAQYTTHDEVTLGYMQDALDTFHAHKSFFTDAPPGGINIRDDLNIPKFHFLDHYIQSIKLLGTTDNYNTEMFERLHIDFAKEGWRASNQREAFPQMIKWLSRVEKMFAFQNYVTWKDEQNAVATPPSQPLSRNAAGNVISLPKHPTQPRQLISVIANRHIAPGFPAALKTFLNQLTPNPTSSSRTAHLHSLPFQRLDVFHTFKFHPPSLEDDEEACDVIKAAPATKNRAARFDTAIILHSDKAESTGVYGVLRCYFMPLNLSYSLSLFIRYKDRSYPCYFHTSINVGTRHGIDTIFLAQNSIGLYRMVLWI